MINLKDLCHLIQESSANDWYKIPSGKDEGPSYSEYYDSEGESTEFHTDLATFKSNIAFSMAYGLLVEEENKFAWLMNNFSFVNTKAIRGSTHIMDIFYHGRLVYRKKYIWVKLLDVYVPYLEGKSNKVISDEDFDFVRLLNELDNHTLDDYIHALRTAGFILPQKRLNYA